jgi:hypothetical protein
MLGIFRTSHAAKFLIVHMIVCVIAVAVMIFKFAHLQEPPFTPTVIAITQTFLGSFAGALLSLVALVQGLFHGFGGAPTMDIAHNAVPMPLLAGLASLLGFILLFAAVNHFTRRTRLIVFVLCSALFLFAFHIYFVGMNSGGLPAHPIPMKSEK